MGRSADVASPLDGLAACFGIAGPGSTNLLTGLYDAKADRAPVLAISGQVPSSVKGRGAFQDLDLESAFDDVADYSETIHAGSNHAELMNLACKHAIVGRGVSHGIADYKPTIQVDLDPMALGRFHAVDVPLLGHVGGTAEALAQAMTDMPHRADRRGEVAERWQIWRDEKARRREDDHHQGVSSAIVFDALSHAVAPDAAMAVDVGNNPYSFGRYFEVVDQSVVMSGYLGSIGFALPAAMGLWAAVGDTRQVVAVCGDGGLGQYAMELTTAVKYGMDITVVLLDNSELGKISKEQRSAELDVWQTGLHNPDFAAFAQLCGAWGRRVTEAKAVPDAIAAALAHQGPALVDIVTDATLV